MQQVESVLQIVTTVGSPVDAAWGPMLCQFLWKKELEALQARDWTKLNEETNSGERSDVAVLDGTDSVIPIQDDGPPPLFDSTDAEEVAYREYNAKYCLNYVQKFFNKHIDDPWFRARLSPLEAVRFATKERKRASAEAYEMRREIVQSLDDATSGVIPKKDPDCPEYLGSPKCNFIASCCLGVGTNPSTTCGSIATNGYHYHHHQRVELDTDMPPISYREKIGIALNDMRRVIKDYGCTTKRYQRPFTCCDGRSWWVG